MEESMSSVLAIIDPISLGCGGVFLITAAAGALGIVAGSEGSKSSSNSSSDSKKSKK
jgi:hypothetical protein